MRKILIGLLFASAINFAQQNGVGSKWQSEKKSWVDETSKYEITQWTSRSTNYHPYFTTESFIDENNVIIISNRTGKEQLFKMNLTTGEMIQMTSAAHLRSIDHLPQYKAIWYLDGEMLRFLNTATLESQDVYDFANFKPKMASFSVTCDAKWIVFSANQNDGTPATGGYGPFAIYKLSLQDKSIAKITIDLGFNIGHIQANPVDPNLIMYCWQWEEPGRPKLVGDTPLRIWWVNIDGTAGGPIMQDFGMHRVHESWTPDGKRITYCGDYRAGIDKGKEVLGIASIDGTVNETYDASVWHAHQNMYKDNKHWVSDLYNHDDRVLVLFTLGNKKFDKIEILFKHASSWKGQPSHPHSRFSPDGRYILFSTDRTGEPQVYTVRVNL